MSKKRQYILFKDEFEWGVALGKPDNPLGAKHVTSTVRENENFKLVEQIIPGYIAPNCIGRRGMVEKVISFIDRKEGRFLLLSPEGKGGITQAYFQLCHAFLKAYESSTSSLEKGKKEMGEDFSYDLGKRFTEGTASLYIRLTSHYRFRSSWSLKQWLAPILSTVWEVSYWEKHFLEEKKAGIITGNEYKKVKEIYGTLNPTFQSYQEAMKVFSQELVKSSPHLGEDIYRYLWINYILQIQDAHEDNVLVSSMEGQLKLVIIDTEFSHGPFFGVRFMAPNLITLLPPFKDTPIEESWREVLREKLSKIEGKRQGFQLATVKKKSNILLKCQTQTLSNLYNKRIKDRRDWVPPKAGLLYTLPSPYYLLYQAFEKQESPLYV